MLVLVILVLVIVFLCVAINAMTSSSKANKLAQQKIKNEQRHMEEQARSSQNGKDTEFEEQWQLLSRYDPDVRPQVERLETHGPGAVNELKRVFAFNKDKKSLAGVADKIIEDIESGRANFDLESSKVYEGEVERSEYDHNHTQSEQEWKCSKCDGPLGTNYGTADELICKRCADV